MASIRIIDLPQADPLNRGIAYGRAAQERIRRIIAVYEQTFGAMTGLTWPQLIDRAMVMLGPAREFAPDLVTEIEGIAQGAELSFEDIFLLNSRSEIMFGISEIADSDECTTLAVLPETTAKGELLVAQNWDWICEVEDCQVMLKIKGHGGKPHIVTCTEAGQVAKMGLNSAGLALVVNNLVADTHRLGLPWIFITRLILEAPTLNLGLGRILSSPRAHSINYLLARGEMIGGQAQAEAVSVETAPEELHQLWAEKGYVCHTNHFVEPCRTFKDLKEITPSPNTYIRGRRAERLLAQDCGNHSVETIKALLADHYDLPAAVCTHKHPGLHEDVPAQTNLGVIMEPLAGRLHYNPGNPCEGEWTTLELNEFLHG